MGISSRVKVSLSTKIPSSKAFPFRRLIEDDVRSIRSDAVSSRGGDDVGSVKDFGGSEYGGSIYSVAATMGSNQNEQEDDEKLLDQLVEEGSRGF